MTDLRRAFDIDPDLRTVVVGATYAVCDPQDSPAAIHIHALRSLETLVATPEGVDPASDVSASAQITGADRHTRQAYKDAEKLLNSVVILDAVVLGRGVAAVFPAQPFASQEIARLHREHGDLLTRTLVLTRAGSFEDTLSALCGP